MAKVYLVDDSEFALKVLEQEIVALGHRVIGRSNNPIDAYNGICSMWPDFIFVDMVMPDQNGVEFIQRLQEYFDENSANSSKKPKFAIISSISYDYFERTKVARRDSMRSHIQLSLSHKAVNTDSIRIDFWISKPISKISLAQIFERTLESELKQHG